MPMADHFRALFPARVKSNLEVGMPCIGVYGYPEHMRMLQQHVNAGYQEVRLAHRCP